MTRMELSKLEDQIKELCEKAGYKVASRRGTYGSTGGSIKIELEDMNEVAQARITERNNSTINFLLESHGIKTVTSDIIGKTIRSKDGRWFTIKGVNPRAPKYAIQITGSRGGSYKCPVTFLDWDSIR